VKTIRLPKHAISGVSAAHSDETTDDEEEFDLDGHYDDGDSELEQEIDEVQIAPQADTTGTPPPRVLPSTRLSLLAAGSPLDGANVPQIDPEADPLKWYYDLSVRSLQRSYHSAGDLQELNDRSKADDAKKHQDVKMKARLSVIIKRSASEGMAEDREIALKKGPKGELGELVEEKEGVGLGKEGRGVNNVLRFSPPPLERFSDALIETLPPVLSPRHSVDGSGKQSLFRKQIKLVKHTFGPGVGVRHPWTARGDTGINARVFLSEDKSIVSRPTPVHGRANEIYFMGIIDILQQYNTVKRVENFFKGFSHDPAMISAVPAIQYAERFVAFLSEHIV
jgi:hypothetical protein